MTIYYDVPNLPGVPPMARQVAGVVSAADAAINALTGTYYGSAQDTTDSVGIQQTWGLFDASGNQVLQPDTFLGFEYRNSSRISNYPLEQGAFENYNKVNDPYDLVVGMACGGDTSRKSDFLDAVETLAGDLNLYTLVTPDDTFPNLNIERMDYARHQKNGASLIIVNLYLVEIRVNTQTQYSTTDAATPDVDAAAGATTTLTTDGSTASPILNASQVQNFASASPQSLGQVQALPATTVQAGPAAATGANSPTPFAPSSGAPTVLPTAYTQSVATGVVRNPGGTVDQRMTILLGTNSIGPGPGN